MKVKLTLFLTIVFIVGAACRTKKPVQNIIEKTVFYTIQAKKDSVINVTTYSITNVQVVDTKIKYKLNDIVVKEPNFLMVEIIDKNKNVITGYTEHPLLKRFDLFSESGEIESKSVSLQQGEVVLRVPYFSDYKKIQITETINFKKSEPKNIYHEK